MLHPTADASSQPAPAIPSHPFVWGVGIESSTLPHLDVDQFEWTGHNAVWRDDLTRVAEEMGIGTLRYAIPWHYIEPERGRFDWSIADERIEACNELGLSLMLDVMHFGTPRWLGQAVGDPEFPESLERLAGAMAERYRGRVGAWCPINEPLVTSLFSGDFGFWPPHGRKWRGYMPVLSRIAVACSRAMRAIRSGDPSTPIFICDAADHFQTRDPSLQAECTLRNLRRFLLLDLIAGRVDAAHPLREWVTAYGMSELDLDWFRAHPQRPDLIGLDYYPHSDWQLERGHHEAVRQRRADTPIGLYGLAQAYFASYGLPMMVTETSIEGKPINREVWLERLVEDTARLREEGVPLVGLIWWPAFDHMDWDGALTHRVGKLHEVGLYKLVRQTDGTLRRTRTPLADAFAKLAADGDDAVGPLADVGRPVETAGDQLPPLADWVHGVAAGDRPQAKLGEVTGADSAALIERDGQATPMSATTRGVNGNRNGGNGHADGDGHVGNGRMKHAAASVARRGGRDGTGRYGIVVFSHLRWGFVWQRPQQYLSRFAKKHPVLFVEEPMFDLGEGSEPRIELHAVMPNVTVACPHGPTSWASDPTLPNRLRELAHEALDRVNGDGRFDRPLLWYYSPMDAAWTLGHFDHRGIVYDCMDELSQFTGAPKQLLDQERRLMDHSDVVFTGGYELWTRKSKAHVNAHFFGCGVEVSHFNQAMDPATPIPPDIDFLDRPILGWFGVIDERVDYRLVGEMARLRPDWSFAMIGPVVKVDPATLPHAPNLYWLGGRDYQQLPAYCKAFDVCMMCFAINDATQYINPTKALEYFATGRPVISTPVRDVVRQWSDLVDIADTAEAFVAAAERAMQTPDQARVTRGLEIANKMSWEHNIEQMQRLIDEAISGDDLRSERKIIGLDKLVETYEYVPTRGS